MAKTIKEKCELLRKSPKLETLFHLSVDDGSRLAQTYCFDGKEVRRSFEELKNEALCFGKFISEKFGREGGFLALQSDTCPEFFSLFWGSIMAGFSVVLLDFSLDEEKTRQLMSEADAKHIISSKKYSFAQSLTIDEIKENAKSLDFFMPRFAGKAALCTSGTTGESRIFIYGEHEICMQVLNTDLLYKKGRLIISDRQKTSLAFLPFHHIFGFMTGLLWCHFLGYETVYLKNRSPECILENCQKYKVELLITVPLLINNVCLGINKKAKNAGKGKFLLFQLLKGISLFLQAISPKIGIFTAKNLLFSKYLKKLFGKSLSCIILGGSHTPNEHLRTINALGYHTVVGFGMTEIAISSVETSSWLFPRIYGSCGKPLTSAEYNIVGKGRTGELCVKGETLHSKRLKAGAEIPPERDGEGFFRTGDIVKLSLLGRMYIKGRSKDVIINQSGENVYPDELEDYFSRLPYGEQMCILGLRPEKQKRLRFFKRRSISYEDIALVLNIGTHFNDESYISRMLSELIGINKRMPMHKKINRLLIVATPFETANGIKVKRLRLKQQLENKEISFRELSLDGDISLRAEEARQIDTQKDGIRKSLRELFAGELNISIDKLNDDSNFIMELGGDSLMLMSIALKIEEMFGISLDAEDMMNGNSVSSITEIISRKLSGEDKLPNALEEKTPITDFKDSREFKEFYQRQQALMSSEMENPYFVKHDSPLFDVSMMDGRETLNFGSYNYVGMSGNAETKKAAIEAIEKLGTSASGSRLLAGEKSLYQELEAEIADWKHAESALVLVSGHATNVTLVGNFCRKGDLIVYDSLAHNSIVEGTRLSRADSKPFPHNDFNALDKILTRIRKYYEKVLIVIEGAYSMDGDVAPVPEFVKIKEKHGCFLMVDEAHSACVIGETGGGVDEYFKLKPTDIDLRMGTISKGLGTCGGYVAGRLEVIEYLRYNLPGFVFSVGISPPLAAAALCAIRQLRTKPEILKRLHENIDYFISYANSLGFDTCLAKETAIIPIMVGDDKDAFILSNLMKQNGVFVPPAVYPAVPLGKARLRFCVISEHKKEQIKQALDTLDRLTKETGIDIRKKK